MPEDESATVPAPGLLSASPAKQSSTTSFVYPVRSLLSAIQPASPLPKSRSTDAVSTLSQRSDSSHDLQFLLRTASAPDAPEDVPIATGEGLNKHPENSTFTFPPVPDHFVHAVEQLSKHLDQPLPRPHSFSSSPFLPSLPSSSRLPPESASTQDFDKPKLTGKVSSPNFRHFPGEERDPNAAVIFSTALTAGHSAMTSSVSCLSQLEGECQGEAPDYNTIPLPLVASSALAATSVSLLPSAASPPLSASTASSLSPPEKNPSLTAIAEGLEHPIPVKPFTLDATENPSPPHSEPLEGEWKTPESSFPADVDIPAVIVENPDPPVNSPTSEEVADDVPDLPYNLSEYGLVHLPPLPSSGHTDYWSGSSNTSSKQASLLRGGRSYVAESPPSGRSRDGSESSKYYSASPEPLDTSSSEVTPVPSSDTLSGERRDRHILLSTSDSSRSGSSSRKRTSGVPSVRDGDSDSSSARESGGDVSSMAAGSNSSEEHVTFRFQYATDENGNHVVVGREGKFQQCEDEPIRTPGAVQGFGVLVAVEDTEETLVVRQVSENSTELLGLSPRYLFSLDCFTDTLPENSAGVLWDNIQFLLDPSYAAPDDEENAPHVFVISGWGEPGSLTTPYDVDDNASSTSSMQDSRRYWTCWCAVHRAQTTDEFKPGLIVMEFELESDTFNPLYPPVFPFQLNAPRNASQGSGSTSTLVSSPAASTAGSGSTIGSEDAGPPPHSVSDTSGDTPTGAKPYSSQRQPRTWSQYTPYSLAGLEGQDEWTPSPEDILESTTNFAKPLPALERLRRLTHRGPSPYGPSSLGTPLSLSSEATAPSSQPSSPTSPKSRRGGRRRRGTTSGAVGMMDVFAVMAQINEQLGAAQDLDIFLKIAVGVIKDLTQFHRVLVYQFDEAWNGQTVAELVDWGVTRDLYRGLHFPASDIPRQARELYMINKVRVLYDRSQPTARIVVRDKADLDEPLNMTHCYLRAMSPIHLKCRICPNNIHFHQLRRCLIDLENMGVRASMSVSIMAFDQLWGLVACHSYGNSGMRVSFPVRQMLRLLSQSISRNIERLSYAQRLHTRKLINTLASDRHPTGYIVSNADDLLGLFDADFGILVIGEGAKILGPNQHGQEILIMAEYLRLKQFDTIQASQAVINDFPDLRLTTGFEVIAGLLYVPLSSGGRDFIAFLRRGQLRDVHWAGKPFKNTSHDAQANLEPRKSFRIWSETVAGRCRAWTDEQLETAGVLALVYGKFIEMWRQKQSALQTTKLTNLLLSNATHEVRTPLNHIINYLEMAMNGSLDSETRDNLVRSHAASKSLLFTINDLLDLTRLESGNETSFNEPFDLHAAIKDAVHIYHKEASRRCIDFVLDVSDSPQTVVGDSRKIRTVVQNLTANALKYTEKGSILVLCKPFDEPEGLRSPKQTAVEIVVADTGCGIEEERLEKIFREFEQVESSEPRSNAEAGVGLGLAVVARIVEQLGGQLRVDSKVNIGSRFSFLIPLALTVEGPEAAPSSASSVCSQACSLPAGILPPKDSDIEGLVAALDISRVPRDVPQRDAGSASPRSVASAPSSIAPRGRGTFEVKDSSVPIRPIKVDYFGQEVARASQAPQASPGRGSTLAVGTTLSEQAATSADLPRFRGKDTRNPKVEKLRILIVEDNDINRAILGKRLTLTGHTIVNATNGQEAIDTVKSDNAFDLVLMDIQMPIVNGFEATRRIRSLEEESVVHVQLDRTSQKLNGRIPIFAVSASLMERQREELISYGLDGWILKPIDFKRLSALLKGTTDVEQRKCDIYRSGGSWEIGGWLEDRLDTTKTPLAKSKP